MDEFHHVGIITALYSAQGGRAAALGTVSEIRAYPWPAGLMKPVWSHDEIKAFVVRQFGKVAAMELLEELHVSWLLWCDGANDTNYMLFM